MLFRSGADICCGTGEMAFQQREIVGATGKVYGLDFTENMLKIALNESSLFSFKSNQGLLHLLPTIHCRPPREVKELELRNYNQKRTSLDPLMDIQEFQSEGIQRPYQYLRRFNRNESLDSFTYQAKSVEGNPADCLHHLLSNCGLKDPSWAELKHFTWFLNLQLKDCESSGFCDPYFFADYLRGFKTFLVKFMIHMAREYRKSVV